MYNKTPLWARHNTTGPDHALWCYGGPTAGFYYTSLHPLGCQHHSAAAHTQTDSTVWWPTSSRPGCRTHTDGLYCVVAHVVSPRLPHTQEIGRTLRFQRMNTKHKGVPFAGTDQQLNQRPGAFSFGHRRQRDLLEAKQHTKLPRSAYCTRATRAKKAAVLGSLVLLIFYCLVDNVEIHLSSGASIHLNRREPAASVQQAREQPSYNAAAYNQDAKAASLRQPQTKPARPPSNSAAAAVVAAPAAPAPSPPAAAAPTAVATAAAPRCDVLQDTEVSQHAGSVSSAHWYTYDETSDDCCARCYTEG